MSEKETKIWDEFRIVSNKFEAGYSVAANDADDALRKYSTQYPDHEIKELWLLHGYTFTPAKLNRYRKA